VFAGHVKQTDAFDEQVLQLLGHFKQDMFEFPEGLAWFEAQAKQLPLLR
jgi:hypothetical protein